MLFKPLDLTTALRPALLPDETLLFVQDAVGLYEGKYKIPHYQRGHAYLTSHRICYVDSDEPRKFSVAIELKDVDRPEYQAGFLTSSAKITLYAKPSKRGLGPILGSSSPNVSALRSASPALPSSPLGGRGSPSIVQTPPPPALRPLNATWICPICSFSNPIPSNFDPATATASTQVPPCLACGIKPPFTTILKAAVSAASTQSGIHAADSVHENAATDTILGGQQVQPTLAGTRDATIACPRCTFVNHPSLRECEICGTALSSNQPPITTTNDRAESPGPLGGTANLTETKIYEIVKLSFRGGGEKIFYERLKGALVQRKWLLQGAPPVPKPPQSSPSPGLFAPSPDLYPSKQVSFSPGVGIAGLERRGFETRKNNETVIGNAFEDLEALMASAKEIVALAETFATESRVGNNGTSAEASAVLSQSAAALGMITTKDMLGSGGGAEDLYISELSRNLAEYLTDDRNGVLHREGGIMSLIDLWAVFNRSRNGVELVSPSDFQRAAELWEKLKLPVRLRRFKSGLLVVQRFDWSDEKTIHQLQVWIQELRCIPPEEPVPWDWRTFGKGISAQEAAQRFGWSVGVAAEELEVAEDRGILCREEGIEGLRYWSNHIMDAETEDTLGDTFMDVEQSFSALAV